MLTVDSQGPFNAERNIRNGFTQPLKMKPAIVLEALLLDYLRHGVPVLVDWKPYAPPDAGPYDIAKFIGQQGRAAQTWRDVERYRAMWPGKFVLKGIMHPDDALRAAEQGVDGIIVSNHGGRKIDRTTSSVEAFPAIDAAVGDKMTLMLDSGIRRGSDIVTALCLGAKFCFVGRATLYGVAAGALPGARRAIAILRGEIDTLLSQLGCPNAAQLGPGTLSLDGEAVSRPSAR